MRKMASENSNAVELCACGRPLHYTNPEIERQVRWLIAEHGETVEVHVLGVGRYRVPRHFIALHGLKSWELPYLVKEFGFELISD